MGGGRENERHLKKEPEAWGRKWCKGKTLDEVRDTVVQEQEADAESSRC